MKLILKTSTVAVTRKIAEAIQEHLRRVGIQLELQPVEVQKLTQDMTEGNFQLYLRTLVGGNQSTDIFKYTYFSTSVPPKRAKPLAIQQSSDRSADWRVGPRDARAPEGYLFRSAEDSR
jgi:ABC-type transport system substrate-binding protein